MRSCSFLALFEIIDRFRGRDPSFGNNIVDRRLYSLRVVFRKQAQVFSSDPHLCPYAFVQHKKSKYTAVGPTQSMRAVTNEINSKCYSDAVDDQFQQIRSGNALPGQPVRQLVESGFVAIPGPVSGDALNELTAAYDQVMAAAAGPDFKIASTTTRMSDLLPYASVFDDVYLYPPLLEACSHIIGEPFKLSSFLARTLRGETPAQVLHADLARDSEDAPLLGFILMVDSFREENGATRFVPTSHRWTDLPCDQMSDARTQYPGEVLGCGERGTMIIFNGAIWHGHTANVTPDARRSIQGYFVRRNARSGFDFRNRLLPAARSRVSPLARYLLGLNDEPQ